MSAATLFIYHDMILSIGYLLCTFCRRAYLTDGLHIDKANYINYTWEQCKLGEVLRTLPFKPFLKIPEQAGKYEIIQQGNEPIIGYANGEPCEDFRNTVIFGDHTLSLYKPKQPFFVATDGVRILQGTNDMDGYYLLSLLEGNSPQSEGYKRYYSILADREVLFTENHYEQVEIGLYFKNLDNLITLHQRKYDKLVNVKKAMLEKMFPKDGADVPEIRFKGFTEAWEQCKLIDIASMHARIGWQNLRTSEFLDSGDYLLITGTDFNDGAINYSTCHYVSKYRYEQDRNIQIRNGSILITKDGTLGKVAYTQGLSIPATLNAGVFNIEIRNGKNVDSKYLFHFLKAPFLMDYVDKKATGGTIKHLNQNILIDFPVAMPNLDEQRKIGLYLHSFDNLITLHQRKLEKLKNLKKACLEKMFV